MGRGEGARVSRRGCEEGAWQAPYSCSPVSVEVVGEWGSVREKGDQL